MPTLKGRAVLVDMGANVDPKPSTMAQWAVLGGVYARLLHKKTRPRVGLLSNGSEEHKGTTLTREAHALLSRATTADAIAPNTMAISASRPPWKRTMRST